MNYKLYKKDNLNIYTVKINKFKYSVIDICFKNKMSDINITNMNMLVDFLIYSCKKYPTKRELSIAGEELYNSAVRGFNFRKGNYLYTTFSLDFLNPKYCEEGYLNKLVDLFKEVIYNPNFKNNKCDSRTFNIVKNRLKSDIETEKESATVYAKLRSLYHMDKDSLSSKSAIGTIEDLEKINESNLVDVYNKFMSNSSCEVYIVGNLEMDNLVKMFKDNFNLPVKDNSIPKDLIIYNKLAKKVKDVEEEGRYEQDSLFLIYNLDNLTDKEKKYVINVYNNIFGSGGLTAKLYKYVREENSLCYNISSTYVKHDSLLSVYVGLDAKDKSKCLELINKAFDEMKKGDFSTEELENAKKTIINSVSSSYDSPDGILSNYYNYFTENMALPEERIKIYDGITKEEVMEIAKKIKLNTIYILKGSE